MLTTILSFVTALPTKAKIAGVGALVLLSLVVYHKIEVRNLNHKIATLQHEKADAISAAAGIESQLTAMTGNRDKLESTIKAQNGQIDALALKNRQLAAQANVDALRRLHVGEVEHVKLLKPETVPPGHDALNAWLARAFQGAP